MPSSAGFEPVARGHHLPVADGARSGDEVGSHDEETESERWRRNFGDLLQELRVAQTGVQILFAFLLTVPFAARFDAADTFQRNVYLVSLLASAIAAAMLISPVAYHRALFRLGRKPELVRSAHRMTGGGLAFLLVAMGASVLLVTDFVLSRPVAVVVTGLTGLWFVLLWGVFPLLRREAD